MGQELVYVSCLVYSYSNQALLYAFWLFVSFHSIL